jgi:hypothetical protein
VNEVVQMMRGGCAVASIVIALFFCRFWRRSGDRLFALFALGFTALAVNWIGLAMVAPLSEARAWFFIARLAAFLLFLTGILEKNLRR